jgi:hypothetical protein
LTDLLAALEATRIAEALRASRVAYPLVNAGHVLGIALLVGAIVPLDLRLLGAWRSVPLAPLARVLRPVAAAGLALAMVTGSLLFAVSAREYWASGIFPAKMALVALGTLNAVAIAGPRLAAASPARRRIAALGSLGAWTAALFAGRWIGYVL